MTSGVLPPGPPFRCSRSSRALEEPQAGTASTVRAFLLVEAPGPWGNDAVTECRLPPSVRSWLAGLERRHQVRPLLIRRPGRSEELGPDRPTRVFAAYVDPGRPWLGTALLSTPSAVTGLDVAALASGQPVEGLSATDEPVFLVCTHGRHDACCAERGRPVAAAFARAAPAHSWEVSHIGGCRFAANVVVLPDGFYYGRVEVDDAEWLVAEQAAGLVELDRLRGRTAYPFPVQLAELHLRRLLGERRTVGVRLHSTERDGEVTTAVFDVDGTTWRARVRTIPGEPRLLTCRATTEARGLTHEVLDLVKD